MINEDRWIRSLPPTNVRGDQEIDQVDGYRWVNTIPKKNSYYEVKKYFLMTALFICGLFFVSAVKNETRNLEKEINNLRASNSVIKFNLDQALIDHEVITSPENISQLAKEHLDNDFTTYKKSQIKKLDEHVTHTAALKKENKNLSSNIKSKITKEIERKKTELKKLQELYSKPERIPDEIKNQIAKKISKKKTELENLYNSPKETITLERVQKWAAIQVVKVFLGMPIIPGK